MLHRLRGLATVSELPVQGRYMKKVKVASRGERLRKERKCFRRGSIFVACFGVMFARINEYRTTANRYVYIHT